jgi:glycosyltransferase involved in cell wall biosynthesis
LSLDAAAIILEEYKDFDLIAVSVTSDLLPQINNLVTRFPRRVKFTTVSNPLSHKEILENLEKSLIYIGCSRSDGISTTFLEALATGCYPVQTSTSCASEWIEKGFQASVVPPNQLTINSTVMELMQNPNKITMASDLNIDLIPVLEHAIDEGLREVAGLTFDAVEVPERGAFDIGGGFGVQVVGKKVLHRSQSSVSSFSHV